MAHESERTEGQSTKAGYRERLRGELLRYAIISGYLYVCIGAVLLFKVALLREEGVQFAPFGFAAAKALILGKFVLIGEAAGIGTRARGPTLLHAVAIRSLLTFVLLVVLSVIEELIVGWAHGHTLAQMLAAFDSRSHFELLATALIMLLVLIPFITAQEISRELGPGELWRMLSSSRRKKQG